MPTIIRDMIDQSSVHDTVNGVEFHRITFVDQVYVNDAVNPYDFYPDVLATAGLAQLYDTYPNSSFNGAICVERNAVGISGTQARVDQVYRASINYPQGQSPIWSLTDQGQSQFVTVYNTYPNLPSPYYAFPCLVTYPNANPQVSPQQKFTPYRTIRASAAMLASTWNTFKDTVRSYVGTINSTNWGSYGRGQWLFAYISLRTADFGYSYFVDLDFLFDPQGFYPYGYWLDPTTGLSPPTGVTPPPLAIPVSVGNYTSGNGIARFSLYAENDFSSLFNFVPD